MKTLILAAIAAVTIGIGASTLAFAAAPRSGRDTRRTTTARAEPRGKSRNAAAAGHAAAAWGSLSHR